MVRVTNNESLEMPNEKRIIHNGERKKRIFFFGRPWKRATLKNIVTSGNISDRSGNGLHMMMWFRIYSSGLKHYEQCVQRGVGMGGRRVGGLGNLPDLYVEVGMPSEH